jgi:type I restriction enzyme S subunit
MPKPALSPLPSGWTRQPLGKITSRVTQRNRIGEKNALTISAKDGLVSQVDYFNRRVASEDVRQYFLMRRGDFAYNKSYSAGYPVGVIRRLDRYDTGIVSPLYICFRACAAWDSDFLKFCFEAGRLDDQIAWVAKEGVRNHGLLNVGVDDFFSVAVDLPPLSEQQRIAEILDSVDESIRTNERLVAKQNLAMRSLVLELLSRIKAPERPLDGYLWGIDAGWSPSCEEVAPRAEEWGVLKVNSITSGKFDPTAAKRLPSYLSPRKHLAVREGDVLLARANGVAELVGVAVEAERVPPRLMLSDKTLRIIPQENLLTKQFLVVLLQSEAVRRQVLRIASGSSGQKNISQSQVRNLLVTVPSVEEQIRIVKAQDAFLQKSEKDIRALRKLREMKRGMMEDLLTGRVRVKSKGNVAA